MPVACKCRAGGSSFSRHVAAEVSHVGPDSILQSCSQRRGLVAGVGSGLLCGAGEGKEQGGTQAAVSW